MEKRIVLSKHDVMRLRGLLSAQRWLAPKDREHLLDLQEEIERAVIVDAAALPADVVAVESTVLVRDAESALCSVYTLVFPAQADLAARHISVLAPLGTALLGYRAGDEVEWRMPGGLRRLKIEAVKHAERSPDSPRPSSRTDRLAA